MRVLQLKKSEEEIAQPKLKGVKLKVYQNKANKQRSLVLPRKFLGDINEAILDKKKKTVFFR